MHKGRLEAFSDGVMAIIITIMVLELKVPAGDTFKDLTEHWRLFVCYTLSFAYVGIYWNNHHHTMQVVRTINGATLWANLHLLFWLSLVPFSTNWLGEHFTAWPIAIYGVVLLMCGVAYSILISTLVRHQGNNPLLAEAIGKDWKGKASVIMYIAALAMVFIVSWVSVVLYTAVALMWLIPDTRIEKTIHVE